MRESSNWKKRASRSNGLSLEHAIKFATALDDKEFSEIEPSKSESNSDVSNSDYLDVSEETLGGNVKSSLEVDTIQDRFVYIFVFCIFVEIVCS